MAQAKAKGTPTAMITDDTPPGFSDNPKMVPEYAITWLVVIYPICEYVPVTCVQITMLIFQVMEGWRNILTLNVLLGNAFCLAYSSSKWLSATHYFYTESFFLILFLVCIIFIGFHFAVICPSFVSCLYFIYFITYLNWLCFSSCDVPILRSRFTKQTTQGR